MNTTNPDKANMNNIIIKCMLKSSLTDNYIK